MLAPPSPEPLMKAPSPRAGLTIAALGIVFGDIGTSPLYAFRTAIAAAGGLAPDGTADARVVLGVLSLILWALTLVVTLKYVLVVLRVDHQGEGGVLALASLLDAGLRGTGRRARMLPGVAVVGAAMLVGDGVITPAISVLSAVEGLGVWSSAFDAWHVPLAVAILLALFAAQRLGALRIGRGFGPAMLAWFATLALGGIVAVAHRPDVLLALSPHHAIALLGSSPGVALALLGAVFLAVTGGEALYADLGQFGRPAIARAWFVVAMPALVLNYLGQGALLLRSPTDTAQPFFALYAGPLLLPVVMIATLATVIASQAVVSGVFSLVRQALRMDLLPRLRVRFHSELSPHDVHVPVVNAALGTLSIAMVVGFGSSAALADAYGIAVAGAMVTTTVLFLAASWRRGGSPRARLALRALGIGFLAVDAVFVLANLGKLDGGGLVPLSIAATVVAIVAAWVSGRRRLIEASRAGAAGHPASGWPTLVPDAPVAAFLVAPWHRRSTALRELSALCGCRFSRLFVVGVQAGERPFVADAERVSIEPVAPGIERVLVRGGYLQDVDLPALLRAAFEARGIEADAVSWVVDLHRPVQARGVLHRLYGLLARLAMRPADYYALPVSRTLEVGVPDALDAARDAPRGRAA